MEPKMTVREAAWQRRLLPLMAGMLVFLALFFLVVTLYQVSTLSRYAIEAPQLDLKAALASFDRIPEGASVQDRLLSATWRTLAEFEAHTIARRYHQANLLLMTRLWTRYLGFITGMILALVGAAFILGKMREAASTLDAQSTAGKLTVASSSPGLLLAVLGTALMITTILVDSRIEVQDGPLYLPGWSGQLTGAPAPAGEMPPPPDLDVGKAAADDEPPMLQELQKQLEQKESGRKP